MNSRNPVFILGLVVLAEGAWIGVAVSVNVVAVLVRGCKISVREIAV